MTRGKNQYEHDLNRCNGDVDQCELYKMVVQRSVVKVACSVTTCASEDTWACLFTLVSPLGVQPY